MTTQIWYVTKGIPEKGIDKKLYSVKADDKLILNVGSRLTYTGCTRGRRVVHVKKHILDEINVIYEWRKQKELKKRAKKCKSKK